MCFFISSVFLNQCLTVFPVTSIMPGFRHCTSQRSLGASLQRRLRLHWPTPPTTRSRLRGNQSIILTGIREESPPKASWKGLNPCSLPPSTPVSPASGRRAVKLTWKLNGHDKHEFVWGFSPHRRFSWLHPVIFYYSRHQTLASWSTPTCWWWIQPLSPEEIKTLATWRGIALFLTLSKDFQHVTRAD